MTTPKVGTIKRGDSRFYVHPETGQKAVGVTSVVGMLPKPFLQHWAAKVVAETAVKNAGTVVQMVLDAGGKDVGAVDWLKGAPRRETSSAAEFGTTSHDLFERMSLGLPLGRVHPDFQPMVDHFQEFLDKWEPEFVMAEETVWNEALNYAGTFDAIAKIRGQVVLLDYKTTRSGVHAEVALQLAAYRRADYIIRPDGGRVPLPKAEGGAVLHVRPEGWSLVPVAIGDEVFDIFQALLKVHSWDRDLSGKVLGKPL